MAKKSKELRFICVSCGKEVEPDKEKSNENWKVVDANKKCKYCGGGITIDFSKLS